MNSPTTVILEEDSSSFLDSNENLEGQINELGSVSKLESNVTIEEGSVSKLESNKTIGENDETVQIERPRFFCDVCKINMAERDKIPHLKGKRHETNKYKLSQPSRASSGRRREMNRDMFSRYGGDFGNRYNDYPPDPRFRGFDPPRHRDFGPRSRGFGAHRDYDLGYGPNARGYGPDSRGYGPDFRGYGRNSRGYGQNPGGYGPNSRGYGPDSRGYGPDSRGCGPDFRNYGPDARRYGPGPRRIRENMYESEMMMDRALWDGPGLRSRADARGMKRPFHERNANAMPNPKREKWYCALCKTSMQMHDKVHHLAGKKHQAQADIRDGIIPERGHNVCFRFLEGECKYGDECKFSHDKLKQLPKDDELKKSSEDGEDLAKEEVADEKHTGEESKQEETFDLYLEQIEGEAGISGEGKGEETASIPGENGSIPGSLENNEDINEDINKDIEEDDELNNIMEGIEEDIKEDIKEDDELNNIMEGVEDDERI